MPCNCGSAHITSQLLQLLSESPTVATMLRPLVCASIAGRVPHTNKALHTTVIANCYKSGNRAFGSS